MTSERQPSLHHGDLRGTPLPNVCPGLIVIGVGSTALVTEAAAMAGLLRPGGDLDAGATHLRVARVRTWAEGRDIAREFAPCTVLVTAATAQGSATIVDARDTPVSIHCAEDALSLTHRHAAHDGDLTWRTSWRSAMWRKALVLWRRAQGLASDHSHQGGTRHVPAIDASGGLIAGRWVTDEWQPRQGDWHD